MEVTQTVLPGSFTPWAAMAEAGGGRRRGSCVDRISFDFGEDHSDCSPEGGRREVGVRTPVRRPLFSPERRWWWLGGVGGRGAER